MVTSVLRSFTISRLLVILFGVLGYLMIDPVHEGIAVALPGSTHWYLSIWYQWDANWYMSIIENGYEWVADDQSNVAFFPLYPFSVRIAGWLLGGRYLIAGLIMSSAYLFTGMTFLYRLVKEDFNDRMAGRAVWLLAIFPTTVFFSTLYTESLFFLTSVAAFYYARKGRWAMCGIWGFLAALTRVTGLLLLIPLAYEYLSQRGFSLRKIKPSLLWIAMVPAGMLTYIVYLYWRIGLPLAFLETQRAGWGHELNTFTDSLKNDLSIFTDQREIWVIYEFAAVVFLAIMIIIGFKKLRGSYTLYMLISLLFPLAGGTSKSMVRYLLVIFPIFFIMSMYTEKRSVLYAVSAVSILLMGISTAAFACGRWVA